jgi:ribosome-associated protein
MLEMPQEESRREHLARRQAMADEGAAASAVPEGAALARAAAELALTRKAGRVVVLDLRGLSTVCDYFVVCHGESDVQVKAIVEAVADGLETAGVQAWHIEGRETRRWVLLDYVDVVVHVFLEEVRDHFRLEDLWADAPRETIADD